MKAKLGVFIDSPGERCFIVDESGNVLSHHDAFAVLTELALTGRHGMVLGPDGGESPVQRVDVGGLIHEYRHAA